MSKRLTYSDITITIGGKKLGGLTTIEYGKPPTDPTMRAFLGLGPVEVPLEAVSRAERVRMEIDARIRAEARLRGWGRS